MQVNKHHTSDCTDLVSVYERVAYFDHRHSGIDEINILQEVISVEGETVMLQTRVVCQATDEHTYTNGLKIPEKGPNSVLKVTTAQTYVNSF
jgi:hypothetical protein